MCVVNSNGFMLLKSGTSIVPMIVKMIMTAIVATIGVIELSEKVESINEKVVTTDKLINATRHATKNLHKHSLAGIIDTWSLLSTIKSPGLKINNPKNKAKPPSQTTALRSGASEYGDGLAAQLTLIVLGRRTHADFSSCRGTRAGG